MLQHLQTVLVNKNSINLVNLVNFLIRAKLKEIVELQDIIKINYVNCTSKQKLITLLNINYIQFFKRYIYEGYLSIEKADNKQITFANKLKKFDKGIKTLEKNCFLNN